MPGVRESLRLASIDIGTNSTRLLVAETDGERTETLDRRMVITRLGEGVDESKHLAPGAVERTAVALHGYREAIEALGPAGVRAAATSAVRDAVNGVKFLDLAEDILGSRPEVLPGSDEARLSFLGAVSDIGEVDGPVLVFDIGGGSTELIVGRTGTAPADGGKGPGEAEFATRSVNVGCVRMSERFLTTDPPSPLAVGRMESFIVNQLKPEIDGIKPGGLVLGVGLAGTVTTICGINQGLAEYDTDRIHHSRLERTGVEEIFRKLASVGIEERKKAMGLEPGRADIIVGGTAVLRAVMDLAGLDEILVSEKDILDGLVLDLFERLAGRS